MESRGTLLSHNLPVGSDEKLVSVPIDDVNPDGVVLWPRISAFQRLISR